MTTKKTLTVRMTKRVLRNVVARLQLAHNDVALVQLDTPIDKTFDRSNLQGALDAIRSVQNRIAKILRSS